MPRHELVTEQDNTTLVVRFEGVFDDAELSQLQAELFKLIAIPCECFLLDLSRPHRMTKDAIFKIFLFIEMCKKSNKAFKLVVTENEAKRNLGMMGLDVIWAAFLFSSLEEAKQAPAKLSA